MNQDAAIKIRMLKGSVQCLIFGLLGLLPILGLPFAVLALWISGKVRRAEKQFWNAASSYRRLGAFFAAIGAVVWTMILILIIAKATKAI